LSGGATVGPAIRFVESPLRDFRKARTAREAGKRQHPRSRHYLKRPNREERISGWFIRTRMTRYSKFRKRETPLGTDRRGFVPARIFAFKEKTYGRTE
jgi:hypothetical protein